MQRPPTLLATLLALPALCLSGCGPAEAAQEPEASARPPALLLETPEEIPTAMAEDAVIQDGPRAIPIAAPREAVWRLVQRTEGPTHFADVSRGVLVSTTVGTKSQGFVLDETGQLVSAHPKAAGRGEVRGTWPDDAWTVSIRAEERAGTSLRVAKWRGGNRWVPQPIRNVPEESVYAAGGRWYDVASDFWTMPAGRGGYLVTFFDHEHESLEFRRVAGGQASPVDMDWKDAEGWPREVYEHPSGRLFVFFQNGEGVHVRERAPCSVACKVEDQLLPGKHEDLHFGEFVARGDTLAVSVGTWSTGLREQMLHRDADGWTLERAPLPTSEFRRVVSPSDDELYAVIGFGFAEQLWQRFDDGVWQPVDLPSEVRPAAPDALDLAVAEDGGLWLAVNGKGDTHAIYQLTTKPTRA